MKKVILSLTLVIVYYCSNAQTNTFPSSGNVGIGTTTPARTLDVVGQIQTSFGLIFNNGKSWDFSSNGNNLYLDETGTATRMVILSGGNIGIGTIAPAAKLNVVGSEAIRVTGTGTSGVTSSGYISFFDSNNTTRLGYIGDGSAGTNDLILLADAGGGLNLGSGGSAYRLYINSSGQISVNTSDAKGYQFAVNGSAIATSMTVKLNANWPDYVFKKDYHLPALAEVKTYIDQNHHLPEVPSEKEVIKDGINLGEMNRLLTKKVEELMLYAIEQDRKQNEQKAINQQQSGQLDRSRRRSIV